MRKLLLLIALTCSVALNAEIKLPSVFGDNMVLQQNSQAAIWGKAEPNTQITISTTWSKAKVDVFSDEKVIGKPGSRLHRQVVLMKCRLPTARNSLCIM